MTDIEVLEREMECVRRKAQINCTNCGSCDLLMEDSRILAAYESAIAALRAQQEAENNEPLTLEELRKMDGQPVWAEEPDGYKHYSRWVLVNCFWKNLIYLLSWPGQVTLETFLANGGKVYRRPPEKEKPNV